MSTRRIVMGLACALLWAACGCELGEGDGDGEDRGRYVEGGRELQDRRWALIEDLIDEGVFTKLARPGTTFRVYTGRAWAGLTIDDKRDFVAVVYAYTYAGRRVGLTDLIAVHDGFTGKRIGHMAGDGRLDLD